MSLTICRSAVFALALQASLAGSGWAQDTAPVPAAAPGKEISSSLKRTGGVFEKLVKGPIHPIFKGVGSGSGPGLGIGYDAPLKRPFEFDADAAMSVRRYWSVTGIGGYHTERVDAEVFGRVRDMPEMNYFGMGNETHEDNRTDYRLSERLAGAVTTVDVVPWLRLGARVEWYRPEIRTGLRDATPNIDSLFPVAALPGLAGQPTYMRYQSSAELRLDPGPGESFHQGTTVRGGYAFYDDYALNQFSFARADLEVQQRFAMLRPYHRLTLHALATATKPAANQTVPFYLLSTLGGKGDIRSIHEYLIGSDATDATLRGYSSFRFRDRHLLLLQAEYRMPLFGPVEGTAFVDAGKVANRLGDLGLTDLHKDFGISLSLMRGPATVVRVDVARGVQGMHLLFSIGRDILP